MVQIVILLQGSTYQGFLFKIHHTSQHIHTHKQTHTEKKSTTCRITAQWSVLLQIIIMENGVMCSRMNCTVQC